MHRWAAIITVDRVLELHGAAIRRHGGGGTGAPPREGCVAGALGSAWSAAEYSDSTGAELELFFAAYSCANLIRRHCFTDGNKRVAWLTMMDILNAIGVGIDCTTDDAEELCLQLVGGHVSALGLLDWLADHAVDFPG